MVAIEVGSSSVESSSDEGSEEHHRYVGGQRLYLAEVSPREDATWVLDNASLDRPRLS